MCFYGPTEQGDILIPLPNTPCINILFNTYKCALIHHKITFYLYEMWVFDRSKHEGALSIGYAYGWGWVIMICPTPTGKGDLSIALCPPSAKAYVMQNNFQPLEICILMGFYHCWTWGMHYKCYECSIFTDKNANRQHSGSGSICLHVCPFFLFF